MCLSYRKRKLKEDIIKDQITFIIGIKRGKKNLYILGFTNSKKFKKILIISRTFLKRIGSFLKVLQSSDKGHECSGKK